MSQRWLCCPPPPFWSSQKGFLKVSWDCLSGDLPGRRSKGQRSWQCHLRNDLVKDGFWIFCSLSLSLSHMQNVLRVARGSIFDGRKMAGLVKCEVKALFQIPLRLKILSKGSSGAWAHLPPCISLSDCFCPSSPAS